MVSIVDLVNVQILPSAKFPLCSSLYDFLSGARIACLINMFWWPCGNISQAHKFSKSLPNGSTIKNKPPQPLAWMQASPVWLDSVWSNGKKRSLHVDYYSQRVLLHYHIPKWYKRWKICTGKYWIFPQNGLFTWIELLNYWVSAINLSQWNNFLTHYLIKAVSYATTSCKSLMRLDILGGHLWEVWLYLQQNKNNLLICKIWPQLIFMVVFGQDSEAQAFSLNRQEDASLCTQSIP